MTALSRRRWLAAALGCTMGRLAGAAPTAVEQRAVGDFDTVLWNAAGELHIEQAAREALSIEAEPAVLAKIVTVVRQRRLSIAFAPGRVESRWPIRFRLAVRSLAALETRGSGSVHIGPLSTDELSLQLAGSESVLLARLHARRLEARLDGASDLAIEGGQVDRQRIVIGGAANYRAAQLGSREADIAIDGSGDVQVAVSDRLVARIAGSGEVVYTGTPRVAQSVTGAGAVRRAPKT